MKLRIQVSVQLGELRGLSDGAFFLSEMIGSSGGSSRKSLTADDADNADAFSEGLSEVIRSKIMSRSRT